MKNAEPTGGPIFIVGAMGSGTTLIRLVLDSHDRIAVPQETGFMRAETAHKFIPFWAFGGQWYQRLGLTEAQLDEHLRAFYDGLFTHFAQAQGKVRWGEKTPWHVWHMTEMARVFPDSAFVAIVRHPGGNVASNLTRFGHRATTGEKHWTRYNTEIVRRGADLGDRLLVGRYEDLVLTPEPFMRELLARLGEPWSPQVLRHHEVQGARGHPTNVEGRTSSVDPIDLERVSRWLTVLDGDDRVMLRQRAAALAGVFGYDVDEPVPVASLVRGSGRLITTGDELAKRAADAGAVDVDSLAERPLEEQMYRPRLLTVRRVQPAPAATGAAPVGVPGDVRGSARGGHGRVGTSVSRWLAARRAGPRSR